MLERISPQVIVLDPPEKLVIETRASGAYRQIDWQRNGNPFTLARGQPFSVLLQEFSNFFDVFFRDNTTVNDLGIYTVDLVLNTGSQVPDLDFVVTPYSKYMNRTFFVLFDPKFIFKGSSDLLCTCMHKVSYTYIITVIPYMVCTCNIHEVSWNFLALVCSILIR